MATSGNIVKISYQVCLGTDSDDPAPTIVAETYTRADAERFLRYFSDAKDAGLLLGVTYLVYFLRVNIPEVFTASTDIENAQELTPVYALTDTPDTVLVGYAVPADLPKTLA